MAKKKNVNSAPATPYTRKERYLSVIAGVTDLDTLPTNPQNREERYLDAIANKPGGGTYTAGAGITIDEDNEISVDTETIQPKLTAGTNITIDADNVISASGGSLYWHSIFLAHNVSNNYGFQGTLVILNNSATPFTQATLFTFINGGTGAFPFMSGICYKKVGDTVTEYNMAYIDRSGNNNRLSYYYKATSQIDAGLLESVSTFGQFFVQDYVSQIG